MFSLIKLFNLEKHSRVQFDPLYTADTEIYDEYQACKDELSPADFMSILDCNDALQSRLDKEVAYSLSSDDEVSFFDKINRMESLMARNFD